jgi:hypothetical protein
LKKQLYFRRIKSLQIQVIMSEGKSNMTRNIIIALIVLAIFGYMGYTMATQGVNLEMGNGAH